VETQRKEPRMIELASAEREIAKLATRLAQATHLRDRLRGQVPSDYANAVRLYWGDDNVELLVPIQRAS